MNLKKTTLATAMGMLLGGASLTAQAALTSNTVLAFDAGVGFCVLGGTFPSCSYGLKNVTTGSWFSMDTDGNGSVAVGEKVAMQNLGGPGSDKGPGVAIHTTFDNTGNKTGSHPGTIVGGENPQFNIWEFFGNTGMDYLSSPMTDLGTDGNGDHRIDMTGWVVSWSGIPTIPMGGDPANFGGDTEVGIMTCNNTTCSQSSTFSLVHNAHVPINNVSGFGGVAYALNLKGTIGLASAVPVPAAAWLFGSGMLGLVGVARRRKKTSA